MEPCVYPWDLYGFLARMGFMMVICVILTFGYEWLEGSVDWGEKGILEFPLILLLLPVILIWSCVWYWVDGVFGWSAPQFPVLEAVFGRTDTLPFWVNNILSQDEIDGMSHQWSDTLPFWIVVLARVFLFFVLAGWFRWMLFLSVPWSELDYEFDWNTPWWLFAIVTGIITIALNYLEEERRDRLWRDYWEAKRKESEEED